MAPSSEYPRKRATSSWYWIWPTIAVLLLLAGAAFAALIATGQVTVALGPGQSPPAEPPPSGPSVRVVEEASRHFKIMDYEGSLYEYSGGFVDCWIEVERDGKKEVLTQQLSGEHLEAMGSKPDLPLTPASVRGHILFLRYNQPRGKEEVAKCDLIITAGWREEEQESLAKMAVRDVSLPEFNRRGQFAGSMGTHRAGGPLRPGQELFLYEKQEWSSWGVKPQDHSARVVRLKCRITSAKPPG